MRLDLHKLQAHLKQPLLPMYLIAGDEPLQSGEALDAIRAAARRQGYTEREILDHDKYFDWQQLSASAVARSLFGERRLIELRLSSSKIGNDGSAAIVAWSERIQPDTLLLISGPKLESGAAPKWVQVIEQKGGFLAIWPIEKSQLAEWLEQRLKAYSFIPDPGVAAWLAERVEGNLLAGVQEIEKFSLLQNKGNLSLDQVIQAVSDSSRYNVFELADAAIDGDANRCLRIIHSLRDDGTASPLVLWALVKEARLLANLAIGAKSGTQVTQLIANRRDIRDRRRPSYAKAATRISVATAKKLLTQCYTADLSIKGQRSEDPWLIFENIILNLTGTTTFNLSQNQ